jgi:hypothetical protein
VEDLSSENYKTWLNEWFEVTEDLNKWRYIVSSTGKIIIIKRLFSPDGSIAIPIKLSKEFL